MKRMTIHLTIHPEDIREVAAGLTGIQGLTLREGSGRKDTAWHRRRRSLEDLHKRLLAICRILEMPAGREVRPAGKTPDLTPGGVEELLRDAEKRIGDWQAEKGRLEARQARLKKDGETLQWLEAAGAPSTDAEALRFLVLKTGWIPAGETDLMRLEASRSSLVILPLLTHGDRVLIAAAAEGSHGFVLRRVLDSLFFTPLDRPADQATSAGSLPEVRRALAAIDQRHLEVQREKARLRSVWQETLETIDRYLRDELAAAGLIDRCFTAGPSFTAAGRLPEKAEARLLTEIQQRAKHPYLVLTTPCAETEAG